MGRNNTQNHCAIVNLCALHPNVPYNLVPRTFLNIFGGKGLSLVRSLCNPPGEALRNKNLTIQTSVMFFFPYNPDKPPGRPTPKSLISVHFGSVSGPFGSVWVLFRVRFGSFRLFLGGVGVGSGRGAFCKGKEHP